MTTLLMLLTRYPACNYCPLKSKTIYALRRLINEPCSITFWQLKPTICVFWETEHTNYHRIILTQYVLWIKNSMERFNEIKIYNRDFPWKLNTLLTTELSNSTKTVCIKRTTKTQLPKITHLRESCIWS